MISIMMVITIIAVLQLICSYYINKYVILTIIGEVNWNILMLILL